MRSIAVMNQKGGVGKTTTSVNLAAGLARLGQRVCLVDLDPQAHSSLHLGVEVGGGANSVYEVFSGSRPFSDVAHMVGQNLWLAPADLDLAAIELELAGVAGREHILRNALELSEASRKYDFLIMDCAPSLGVLTINALTSVEEVFIPLQPHFFALQGLSKLFETTALVTRRLNRKLRVSGIVLCLYESGTRLASDVTDDLMRFLSQSDPQAPWAGARVFGSRVRRNIKLAEAPSHGQSIFDYAPTSTGAYDYLELVREVLATGQAELPTARAA